MSSVFPRHMKSNHPTAVAGAGCYIIDSDGKRYLDGSGGAAVSCLGHGHRSDKYRVSFTVLVHGRLKS